MEFKELKRNLKKDFSGFKVVKLAILGDSATQLLHQAIKGYGYNVQINFEIFEADYNQIDQQVYDLSSELYSFNPEYILIFHAPQKLLKQFYKTPFNERSQFADNHLAKLQHQASIISQHLSSRIVYLNFPEINDGIFGNFANKVTESFVYQLRKINFMLMGLSQKDKSLFILDAHSLKHQVGHFQAIDAKMYINADIVYNLEFISLIAKNFCEIVKVLQGKFAKCLVLDLDNTTWGGIIGDDGLENIQIGDLGIGKAFTELQLWAKELKNRGIILAICSKNTEGIAKEPFEKHPDMILRLEDIAVFVANWHNKVDNLKFIRETLNIGFDSMVFLDDNPFERGMVRTHIPEIVVPELPEDPAEYLPYLTTLNLFETASFTSSDGERTKQYQEEAKRAVFQNSFANENDYLASLNMISHVKPFDQFNIPRVAQLTQRSNQFNLRTIRYTEDEIRNIANSNDYICLTFSLADAFGDSGLISLVILKKEQGHLFIDTWIMSCRVLKRGMESFVLNKIAETGKNSGYSILRGEYLPTPKNELVRNLLPGLGFSSHNGSYVLDLTKYEYKENFIKEAEQVSLT